jgi:hypothetical protein
MSLDISSAHNLQARTQRAFLRALDGREVPRAADFTSGWLNQGTATADDVDTGIYFSDTGGMGDRARSLLKPMPAPPFTAEMVFNATELPFVDNLQFGLQVRDSASGRGVNLIYRSLLATNSIVSHRWSAANTYSAANHFFADYVVPTYQASPFARPNGFRIEDDGTNHRVYLSWDAGDSWWQLGGNTSRTAYLANPDRIGIFMNLIITGGSLARRGVEIVSFRTF